MKESPMIESFSSLEEMLSYIREQKEAGDSLVGAEALQFKIGCFYARIYPEFSLIIYGEILDPAESERKAGADEDWCKHIKYRYENDLKHFRMTKSYSEACEDGEYGDVHVSNMHVLLSKEEFEKAKQLNWPVDIKILFSEILNLPIPKLKQKKE